MSTSSIEDQQEPANESATTQAGGTIISGIKPGDGAGYSIASVGDMNGDGIDDVVVAAPGADVGSESSVGEVYVVFGSTSGLIGTMDLSTLDGTDGFKVIGPNFSAQLGFSVAPAGDVNGDGINDLVVGANGAHSDSGQFTGKTYVIFGSADGFDAEIEVLDLNGLNGFSLEGVSSNGYSVSSAGDVNGDSIDDLIIGSEMGDCYVVFGSDDGLGASVDLSALDGTNGFQIQGYTGADAPRWSVSSAGDVNNDGLDDLLIGAFGTEAYVLFGTDAGFSNVIDLSLLDGANGFQISGNFYSQKSVASAGDINGDGIDDIIVAEKKGDVAYIIFGTETGFDANLDVSDLDGVSGFQIYTEPGESPYDVESCGDINGDGIDDFIIGVNGFDGQGVTYVVFGSLNEFDATLDLSTIDGRNGFKLNGVEGGDGSGFSVASAGDVNGDGIDDILIGAPYADPNGQNSAGEVYLVLGGEANLINLDAEDGVVDGVIDLANIGIDYVPGRYRKPSVTVASQVVPPTDWISLEEILDVSGSIIDGGAASNFLVDLLDNTGADNFWYAGEFVDASSGFVADDLSDVFIQADAVQSTQTLYVRVYDGYDWSAWDAFTLTSDAGPGWFFGWYFDAPGWAWTYGWHVDWAWGSFIDWDYGWHVDWAMGWSYDWAWGWHIDWAYGWSVDWAWGSFIDWDYGWNVDWAYGWSIDWDYGWHFDLDWVWVPGSGWRAGWAWDYGWSWAWDYGWSWSWDYGWSWSWDYGWSWSWAFGWSWSWDYGWSGSWSYGWTWAWDYGWSWAWGYGWSWAWDLGWAWAWLSQPDWVYGPYYGWDFGSYGYSDDYYQWAGWV